MMRRRGAMGNMVACGVRQRSPRGYNGVTVRLRIGGYAELAPRTSSGGRGDAADDLQHGGTVRPHSHTGKPWRLSRRAVLALPIAVSDVIPWSRRLQGIDEDEPVVAVSVKSRGAASRSFERQDFGTVGIFDVDWLVQPQFTQLLDNLAASPGAFHGVRFFG